MKPVWYVPLLASASFVGCGLVNVGTGTSDGTGGASAAAGVGGGAAQGVDCGADPNSGVTLCLGISLCSGLSVDQSVYPNCGFFIDGDAITVACVCGGYLCPLGATATCSAVQTLLAQQNEGAVCAEQSAGGCTALTTGTSASSSSGGGSGTGCDMTCEQECDGDPTCIEYTCGC
jgi:hypothetical protein